jgi:hypothetical protein
MIKEAAIALMGIIFLIIIFAIISNKGRRNENSDETIEYKECYKISTEDKDN